MMLNHSNDDDEGKNSDVRDDYCGYFFYVRVRSFLFCIYPDCNSLRHKDRRKESVDVRSISSHSSDGKRKKGCASSEYTINKGKRIPLTV